jgi:glycosyltransferase involved in cell wall biosynthesis
MRIIYLNHSGKVSGGEISLLTFFKGLKGRKEIEPVLVCPTEGTLKKKAQGMGLPVVDLEPFEAGFTRNPLSFLGYGVKLLRTARRFASIVKQSNANLIDANSVRAGLVASISTLFHKIPILVHVRDCVPRNRIGILTRRIIAGRASKIIANSSYVAHHFALNSSMLRKIDVVYNPLDLPSFDPQKVDGSQFKKTFRVNGSYPLLGAVGQISPWKGLAYIIRAMSKVLSSFPEARLLVVGEPKFDTVSARYDNVAYFKELKSLVEKLNLKKEVIFTGERSDIPGVMKAIDLLILASWEEPFGRTLIEAMAMEKPVISTNVGGPTEILEDGVTGILLPPKNPQVIARTVIELASDRKKSEEMGRKGRAEVQRRFNTNTYVTKMFAIYKKNLDRRNLESSE